jgi:hypothetical protein
MEIVSANLFYFTGKIARFTMEISGCLDVFRTCGCYGAFVLTSMLFVETQKYQVMVELDLHEPWMMTSVK